MGQVLIVSTNERGRWLLAMLSVIIAKMIVTIDSLIYNVESQEKADWLSNMEKASPSTIRTLWLAFHALGVLVLTPVIQRDMSKS